MTPHDARARLRVAADALPDGAVLLVARLLALGVPGTDEVLGVAVVERDDGDAAWDRGVRERGGAQVWLRSAAAEVWRLLARGGGR